ncbi:hypothetical protein AMK59_632 [Oryctes borbonicus]|uniref:Uncharacterized protein n=1 Tax=Oryctes borbonicus TaxID=1629725 RepID=A0A0T6BC99_9SCAR|nr:hypothetical protein AMK59_632 [Oryctes borbonicus]
MVSKNVLSEIKQQEMMISKALLLVVVVCAFVQAQNPCINCGLGSGKDVCSPHSSQMIVRPQKLMKIEQNDPCKPKVVCHEVAGMLPLKPIGDLCCCNRAIVTPAHVPKPHCPVCDPCCASMSSSSASSSSSSSSSSSAYNSHHYHSAGASSAASSSASQGGAITITVDEYGHPVGGATPGFIPADPVSLAIAYNLKNNINKMAEDKLSFGFRIMPKEITIYKPVKPIFPEENLYGINGQVVELKPIASSQLPNIEEEAVEALMHANQEDMEEHHNEDVAHVKKLTYHEIGFGPAKVKDVPYIQVQGQVNTGSSGSKTECQVPCCDGYIPGKVIMQPVRKHEVCCQYTDDEGYETDHDDMDDDDDDEDDVYVGPYGVHYPPYRNYQHASSSSASSSSSSSSHSIIIEKLRCS